MEGKLPRLQSSWEGPCHIWIVWISLSTYKKTEGKVRCKLPLKICLSLCGIHSDGYNVCCDYRNVEFQWVQEGGVDLILSTWYTPAVQENPRLPRQHYGSEYVSTICNLAPWSVGKNEITICVVHDWRLNVVYYLKRQKKELWSKACVHLSGNQGSVRESGNLTPRLCAVP
jgi:hypothetical protein